MHRTTLELMRSHVREIHQALTGMDPPEEAGAAQESQVVSADGVMRLFSDLEAAARTLPGVSERLPPFAFEPPVDLIEGAQELIVELAVPGVALEDLLVEARGDTLTVSGGRAGGNQHQGYRLRHAEIARGPFYRALRLPQAVSGEPRVRVDAGLIRVALTKVASPSH